MALSPTLRAARMTNDELMSAYLNSNLDIEDPETRALVVEIEWRGLQQPPGFTPILGTKPPPPVIL